jgi:hypothetical protein
MVEEHAVSEEAEAVEEQAVTEEAVAAEEQAFTEEADPVEEQAVTEEAEMVQAGPFATTSSTKNAKTQAKTGCALRVHGRWSLLRPTIRIQKDSQCPLDQKARGPSQSTRKGSTRQ